MASCFSWCVRSALCVPGLGQSCPALLESRDSREQVLAGVKPLPAARGLCCTALWGSCAAWLFVRINFGEAVSPCKLVATRRCIHVNLQTSLEEDSLLL